ncbi:major histocompatibility complex class I-related gene protein-like [Carassius gibelio]|uniref:major histocompatibility complex class I-related gene protein-like n=1 Tax=Carassius gibelio TaxID=101364 RepID=UPI0022781927|nr:major histocompatibility complex class I-related gene protein-like [Carassius gibelio]
MNYYIFFIYVPLVHSASHTLITTYTGVNGQTVAGTPEFSAVTILDGQQIDYYDSVIKKLIPKQDWMKEFASTDQWIEDTEIRKSVQQIYKKNFPLLMQRFNQTHGVHTYQRMYGCDWDDETGKSRGFDEHGYDGEDFIFLDIEELRYITAVPQGIITMMKWNNDRERLELLKQYYKQDCIDWLKDCLKLRKDLKRRAPEVSLVQTDSSSPVVCHATDFYPSAVNITWLRNGEEHDEDVDLGETLPNEDGTFQKSSILRVTPDEWEKHQYVCVVEHEGKTIQKTEDEIKSNYRLRILYFTILMHVTVLILVIATTFLVRKKKMHRFKTVDWLLLNPSSDSDGRINKAL